MNARLRMLERVRSALEHRDRSDHPGDFGAWRSARSEVVPVDGFEELFQSAGGEVVRRSDHKSAAHWIEEFSSDFASVALGETVPDEWAPGIARAAPDQATLGISIARAAVAETGSLVMDARDGRRAQLLVPTHVVVVEAVDVRPTLKEVLESMANDLPSALGFHSGPSKSADIGQIMVTGVHGPGRVVALIVGSTPTSSEP